MIVGDSRYCVDAAGSRGVRSSRFAPLLRGTSKVLEQLLETMLAVLHADAGALWLEHEHDISTLAVRSVTIQDMQALLEVIAASGQSYPAVVQAHGRSYVVTCTGYPLLRVYAAARVEKVHSSHRNLMSRFARLALSVLQTNNAPVGMPAEDASHRAYRMVVESSLRRLAELMQATGCVLVWFSSWYNSWHRFAVGNVPPWLYQHLWEIPSPGGGFNMWMEGVRALVQRRGYHCAADDLVVNNMTKGYIFVWRAGSNGDFASDEVEWLRVTVGMIAASLDVLETQTELLQKVYHDPLTGVFNRLYFDMVYRQVLCSAQRHPRPVSLLLMDIDGFKGINDAYGHETGDMVLQMVGQVLQQVRAGDVPARYGGDEFVVLLPDTDKQGARILAKRLQSNLQHSMEQMNLPFTVTLTIGCATVTDGDSSLLLLADQDMYEQKRQHRPATA